MGDELESLRRQLAEKEKLLEVETVSAAYLHAHAEQLPRTPAIIPPARPFPAAIS